MVATNMRNRWIFVHGFEKNDRANISDGELEAFKDIAAELLGRTVKQLDEALNDGSLTEICNDQKNLRPRASFLKLFMKLQAIFIASASLINEKCANLICFVWIPFRRTIVKKFER